MRVRASANCICNHKGDMISHWVTAKVFDLKALSGWVDGKGRGRHRRGLEGQARRCQASEGQWVNVKLEHS